MENAHAYTVDEVVSHFNVKEDIGLDNTTVEKQRRQYGLNGMLMIKILSMFISFS